MISANECKQLTAEAEKKQEEYVREQRKKIREKTLEYCNTTLSEYLKEMCKYSKHCCSLDFQENYWYDSYQTLEKSGSYWRIKSYEYLNIEVIKEFAEAHGFVVEITERNYVKSSKNAIVGKRGVISW